MPLIEFGDNSFFYFFATKMGSHRYYIGLFK